MAYADFTLQSIEERFGVVSRPAELFPNVRPFPAPSWLQDHLARGLQLPLVSEKARSELIVMPVLLGVRELSHEAIAIFSGPRLNVSPEQGLLGECDFLLARAPAVPEVRAPLVAIVEAKKNDVEAGLGQCVAQMIGARMFNERSGQQLAAVYGCVTTGEVWQFLRLEGLWQLLTHIDITSITWQVFSAFSNLFSRRRHRRVRIVSSLRRHRPNG